MFNLSFMTGVFALVLKTAKKWKNKIWKDWADLFKLSFMTGVFPLVPKTANVISRFKKLDYNNYCLFSLLQILKNTWKNIDKRLYTFLNNNNVIYNLQFGFRQQYSTSHALINITENIRKVLDDGNHTLNFKGAKVHLPSNFKKV